MDERHRSIWVVDDSPLDGGRTADTLRASYDVLLFSDGSALIEHLASHSPPDVLVLDWMMPGISGLDVCRFIRSSANPASRAIAILLLTSHQRTEQIVEGLSSGANDYLSKPYAEEELKARVAALMRSVELLERTESAERALRAVLDSAPDALFVLDAEGRVSYANAEGRAEFSLDGGSRGRPISELVPGLVWRTLAPGANGVHTLDDVLIKDAVYSPVIRSFALPGESGELTLSLRNVTERRHRESKRLDFYAMVAHDPRSPLSAVLLRTEILLRGAHGVISEVVQADIKNIRKNVNTLVALINDFLDLARLESPVFTVEKSTLNFSTVVAALVEDLKPLADAEEHGLQVTLPEEPTHVVGDRARLGQVLTNLISNAIKFTPRGGKITVSVQRSGNDIDVRVTDTGPGIDEKIIPTLGQRYVRVKGAQASGTGLGLMIAREILEAHGAALHIESERGKGSTFWFRLPWVPTSRPSSTS